MALPRFASSARLSLGVELELQLIDPSNHDLTPKVDDLLRATMRTKPPGDVKHEITQSMIEISTTVHTRHDALRTELRDLRDCLVSAATEIGIGVAGGGTHPFQRWSDRVITEKPRYDRLSSLYGYLAKQFTVFGQHVHVGCESADQALWLVHVLGRYIPHFIALSASSPFSQGVDTQFDSSRLNSIFAFPLSGRAPFALTWGEFERYFGKMTALGVVESMKDFYWDIRPKPEFGTVEVRVCDTPLTVDRAAALAGYLQALCSYLLRERPREPSEDDYLPYTFNRFQACRFGLDGLLVDTQARSSVVIRDDVAATLERIAPHATDLGAEEACREIASVLQTDNDAAWLRRSLTEHDQALPSTVAAAVRRWSVA